MCKNGAFVVMLYLVYFCVTSTWVTSFVKKSFEMCCGSGDVLFWLLHA